MKQTLPSDRSDSTCEALIAAGRELFARHGFDGASVRAIAAAAGANLGAINYHFGSKRALYESVVASVMDPLAEDVVAALSTPGTPLDRAAAAERAYFAHFAANPGTPRLMLQELAAGRSVPHTASAPMRRIHGAMVAMIREGQADGSMRAGPPELMALGIVSQPVHLHLVLEPLRAATGIDMQDAATAARIIDNAVSFVRGGLAAQNS